LPAPAYIFAALSTCAGDRHDAPGDVEQASRFTSTVQRVLEFSVLWAVFPLLDRFVAGTTIEVAFGSSSMAISLTTLAAGLILKKGHRS
jgi:hypothetical protein